MVLYVLHGWKCVYPGILNDICCQPDTCDYATWQCVDSARLVVHMDAAGRSRCMCVHDHCRLAGG